MKNTLLLMALVLIIAPCTAQQKKLWATATVGGAYGYGTILKGDSTGTNFTVVHSFDQTNGSYPIGKMAIAGNGVIYIVTELGGIDDSCTVCTFNPANDSFSMIHQFFANVSTGGVPGAGVIVASNNIIYGTTTQGGATFDSISGVAGGGVIYSIDPATNTYTDVYDFPDSNGYGPTSELFQAADGKLYGMVSTSYTDSLSSGYLFSFNPANNQFTLLGNLYPSSPSGYRTPPLVQGPDLKLYGVIQNVLFADSPSEAPGVLFSYDINNSNLTIVHTFSIADGTPLGGLLVANGNIYGETANNIVGNNGEMYSYNIANAAFNVLAYFDSSTGVSPIGGLGMLGNNQLTGSAMAGGLYNNGTLFTFNLTYNTFSKMLDFDSATIGAYPQCDILESTLSTAGINTPANTGISISLSPDITADNTYVRITGIVTTGTLRFAVYDLTGKLLLNTPITANQTQVDCSNLPSAVYIWRVLDENENIVGVGKLVKQ